MEQVVNLFDFYRALWRVLVPRIELLSSLLYLWEPRRFFHSLLNLTVAVAIGVIEKCGLVVLDAPLIKRFLGHNYTPGKVGQISAFEPIFSLPPKWFTADYTFLNKLLIIRMVDYLAKGSQLRVNIILLDPIRTLQLLLPVSFVFILFIPVGGAR